MSLTVDSASIAPAPQQAPVVRLTAGASQARASTSERWAAAILALGCAAILGVAMWLTPSPAGIGTHQQLGLAPCGWATGMNMPCPSCGMTTAFTYAAHGSLLNSFLVQPMGAILALATATVLVVSTYVALTGSMVGHALSSRISPRFLLVFGLVALLAWGYKILLHRGYLPFIPPLQ